MNNEIKVPSLGESISEATIGQILAPTGTIVKIDAEILELETDKVNQVLYAPQAGRVTLTVKTGETVKIGQTIGTIERVTMTEVPVEPKPSLSVQPQVEITKPFSPPPVEEVAAPQEGVQRPTSSFPLGEESIRYTKEKFLNDLQSSTVPSTSQSELKLTEAHVNAPENQPSAKRETRRSMSKIRKVIAQRMVEAQQTMAMLTTFNEVDLTLVIQLREKYKDSFIKKYGCKLGFMSFFVKATVSALQAFPDLNSFIDGEEIVHREYYDIGVAVGTERGVIVPVIRNCDQLSFAQIEQAIESHAKKAREGTLVISDLQGGGFTITNGGVYGSLLSTPILMPPQCGILGLHKIEKRPVVINDQIAIRSLMYVALSYDHRLVDGKEAVSFLVRLKNLLEDPSRLLLDI